MGNTKAWIAWKARQGWILLVAGVGVIALGVILERAASLPFNTRIITGLGILLLGLGAANRVMYGLARRDPQAARQMVAGRDERMQLLRGRAGHRAYLASTGLAYALLMWVSLSSNGSLPELSADGLWFALAGVVVLPFVVYAASLAYDQTYS